MLAPFAAFPPGHLTVGAHQTDASPHQMCNPKISQRSSFYPELDLTNTTIPTQQLAHKRIRLWAQGQYQLIAIEFLIIPLFKPSTSRSLKCYASTDGPLFHSPAGFQDINWWFHGDRTSEYHQTPNSQQGCNLMEYPSPMLRKRPSTWLMLDSPAV